VLVPNLVGLLEADAQKVIGDSDLMTTYVNYQTANDVADKTFFGSVPPGAVLSQHPSPGTRVPRGTRISLAVRKS
jgi:beta-lactam-binding protein with PASTA domain